jgi:hypothetical protein
MEKEKKVVGIVEKVTLIGKKEANTFAVFDTGARMTSIDTKLASEAQVGPIIGTTTVKNPSIRMKVTRPTVKVQIKIKGEIYKCKANMQDRSHMTSKMLIGRDIMSGKFVVDPQKNLKKFKSMKKKKNSPEEQGIRSIDYFSNGRD